LDDITLVIALSFGGLIALVLMGFFMIQHRTRSAGPSPPYETKDYYSQYAPRGSQESRYSYDSSRRPFRSDAEIEENQRRQRQNAMAIMFVIIVVALVAVVIASLFDPLNLIFLIFLLPIAISYIRSRRNRNSQDRQDDGRR